VFLLEFEHVRRALGLFSFVQEDQDKTKQTTQGLIETP
jgi:hypothetical protein